MIFVKQNKTKKKTMEFSKIIILIVGVLNLAVILFSCVMIWRTMDLSPLCYLIPSISAEFSAGTVAYYSKAKVENRIKLMASCGVAPTEQSFSENF